MNESAIPDQVLNGSSEERKKALENFLKGTYPDYIDKLNELLKDPKTAALLEEAFSKTALLKVMKVECRGHHPHGMIGSNAPIVEFIKETV